MATKSCSSCGAEVPVEAFRCKHCFHDFNEAPKKKGGPLVLLAFLAIMAVGGAGVLGYILDTRAAENSVIDKETQTIVITRTSATGVATERVPFETVEKLEYITGGSKAMFEIVAVTVEDKRYTIKYSDKQIRGQAEVMARVIDKPMVEVQKMKTFAD